MSKNESIIGSKKNVLCPWNTSRSLAVELLKKGNRKKFELYNLLYVVQSKADVENEIYKIGVSSGYRRLSEYYKHHGDERVGTSKCSGVNLIYLAGTKKPNLNKDEAERRSGYALKKPWSRIKEQAIFRELKKQKYKASRGAEWFHISGKVGADTLKEIVENNDTKSGDLMVLQRKSKRIRKPNKRYITI
jgi:hypothetical protein